MNRDLITPGAVAITGHRPGGIPHEKETREAIGVALARLSPSLLYQGMAAGVDVWAAAEAWRLGIPYIAVKPWETHKAVDIEAYEWVIRNAQRVDVVNPAKRYLGAWLFHARNVYMVDRAETVLAVWNGQESGGTYHALSHALITGKTVYRIDPLTQEFSKLEG